MSNHFLYRLFYIGKSTAWVVPIFSIFLVNEKGMEVSDIVYIAGLFGVLPFIFEVPFGVLSDKWSNKNILKLGLVSFILAFVSILGFGGIESYFFYMLFITLSSSLFSGAEDKLLCAIIERDEIEHYKFELNSLFYKATIPMILIGGVLYNIQPEWPFYFQLFSFVISFVALARLPNMKIDNLKKKESTFELIKSSTTDVYNIYFLSIALMGSVCAFLVAINTRTVQVHFEQLLTFNPTVVIGLFFVLGNVASAYASDVYRKYLMNRWLLDTNFVLLGLVSCLAFALMSVDDIVVVFMGYVVLCGFKSVYRPIISANLMTALKSRQSFSTAMSIAAMLSAIMGLLLSALYSWGFSSFSEVNLILSALSLGVFVLGAWVVRRHNEAISEQRDVRSMSQKKHFVKRFYSQWSYIQQYPRADDINPLFLQSDNRGYPSPKLLSVKDNQVEWEYISGELLSSLHRDQQRVVINTFSQRFNDRKSIPHNEVVIHGDLHPDNILVSEGRIYVVDWDLASLGDPLFDALTLITSPTLDLTNQERVAFIVEAFEVTERDAYDWVTGFLRQKSEQLADFLTDDYEGGYLADLVQSYRKLTTSFALSSSHEP
ncbi:MFS transporter [Vibrio sp. Isolate31]|uniref:MFS transporter n=1 Tax=unclassified Vibrio TaxID=2614977 RepID=UPI001EFE763F|nr:MFS transporter [Vibrio sp. Isolate32]MCG9602526.1 MFS transporter [Vibrio sp. Isolate31]